MWSGLECLAGRPARVSTGWELSSKRAKSPVVAPTSQGPVSDCTDHNIQTIAARLSQCLIVDILNDVMWFGLECLASKGLHGLGIEFQEGKKSGCAPNQSRPSQ
eukprot:scaffold147982_cov50-Cyclotella_meneghiniana.AAC.1